MWCFQVLYCRRFYRNIKVMTLSWADLYIVCGSRYFLYSHCVIVFLPIIFIWKMSMIASNVMRFQIWLWTHLSSAWISMIVKLSGYVWPLLKTLFDFSVCFGGCMDCKHSHHTHTHRKSHTIWQHSIWPPLFIDKVNNFFFFFIQLCIVNSEVDPKIIGQILQ